MTSLKMRPHAVVSVYRTPDNRAQPRTTVFTPLTLIHDDVEVIDCHALNISNTGVYVELPCGSDLSFGDLISLRFHIWTGNDHMTRFLHAKVLRCGEGALAAIIIDHVRIANAVVQDILHYQQLERRLTVHPTIKRLSFSANLSAWVARLIL